jgi:hypothetical protein
MIAFRWANFGGIYLDSNGDVAVTSASTLDSVGGIPRLSQRMGNHRKTYMAKDLKFDTGRRIRQSAKQKNIFVI